MVIVSQQKCIWVLIYVSACIVDFKTLFGVKKDDFLHISLIQGQWCMKNPAFQKCKCYHRVVQAYGEKIIQKRSRAVRIALLGYLMGVLSVKMLS